MSQYWALRNRYTNLYVGMSMATDEKPEELRYNFKIEASTEDTSAILQTVTKLDPRIQLFPSEDLANIFRNLWKPCAEPKERLYSDSLEPVLLEINSDIAYTTKNNKQISLDTVIRRSAMIIFRELTIDEERRRKEQESTKCCLTCSHVNRGICTMGFGHISLIEDSENCRSHHFSKLLRIIL